MNSRYEQIRDEDEFAEEDARQEELAKQACLDWLREFFGEEHIEELA